MDTWDTWPSDGLLQVAGLSPESPAAFWVPEDKRIRQLQRLSEECLQSMGLLLLPGARGPASSEAF